jgi:hypothetical protein
LSRNSTATHKEATITTGSATAQQLHLLKQMTKTIYRMVTVNYSTICDDGGGEFLKKSTSEPYDTNHK